MHLHRREVSVVVEGENTPKALIRNLHSKTYSDGIFLSELTLWCVNVQPIDCRFCHLLHQWVFSVGVAFGWGEHLAPVTERIF